MPNGDTIGRFRNILIDNGIQEKLFDDVVSWHIKRFLLAGIIAVLLGMLLSVPATNLMMTPIFKFMGMHQVHYKYNLLKILLIYPGIILGVTAVSVSFTALYTNKIKSSDTANIE